MLSAPHTLIGSGASSDANRGASGGRVAIYTDDPGTFVSTAGRVVAHGWGGGSAGTFFFRDTNDGADQNGTLIIDNSGATGSPLLVDFAQGIVLEFPGVDRLEPARLLDASATLPLLNGYMLVDGLWPVPDVIGSPTATVSIETHDLTTFHTDDAVDLMTMTGILDTYGCAYRFNNVILRNGAMVTGGCSLVLDRGLSADGTSGYAGPVY